jgi:hypothetical protein
MIYMYSVGRERGMEVESEIMYGYRRKWRFDIAGTMMAVSRGRG